MNIDYQQFLGRLRALDLSITDFCMYFGRMPVTMRKRGAPPHWAVAFLTALEEFPGLLEYYKHLMALYVTAEKERKNAKPKRPQPSWLVGTQRKRSMAQGEPAPDLESSAPSNINAEDNMPMAGGQ